MDVARLGQIIREEGLDVPLLHGVGRPHPDAVVLDREGGRWTVHLLDERHAVIATTVRVFDDESDALEQVLLKLRQVSVSRAGRAHGDR